MNSSKSSFGASAPAAIAIKALHTAKGSRTTSALARSLLSSAALNHSINAALNGKSGNGTPGTADNLNKITKAV
jgi:hypothetical protein